jgi:hypothetical protein
MTHRDPVDVVGSACSLLKAVRPMYTDSVDLAAIGVTMVETFDKMIERTIAYKEQHGQDSIYDLQYTDLMRDPIGEIKKLYEHFSEPFSAQAEEAMTAFMKNNRQDKHGRHTYSVEDYGLTREQVSAHYRDYCERFNIPIKS